MVKEITSETSETSETELWAAFKSGDKAAFKTIYYRYYMLLFRYGIKISSNQNLVEDSLQDMFLKLWKNRVTLGEVASIKSYLYRAYMRTLFDVMKKAGRTYSGADLDFEEAENSIEESLIKGEEVTQSNHRIHSALQHLSKRQKQVVILYFFEGLSYKQIAEILPIKYQGIRNCVHEAIKVLRKNMATRCFIWIMASTLFFLDK
jgi:RNA polymerase sigma factor (sigma-70 family)